MGAVSEIHTAHIEEVYMHLGAALAPVLFMAAATPTVFGLDLPREMRAGSVPSGGEAMRLPQRYGQLPLTFEANRGQTAPEVKYLSRGRGYGLFLTPTEAVLVLEHPSARDSQRVAELSPTLGRPRGASVTYKTALRLRLEGARTEPQIVGLEEEPGKVSYLIGNDAREWRTGIPTYAKVRYRDVYPGVDLIYYGSQGQLEYDFVVAAGIDPEVITLSFEGVDGLDVDALGNLIAHVAGQQLSMRRPFIYQEYDGIRHEVAGGYRVLSNTKRLNDSGPRVAFRTGTYDASRPLVIDPVLAYSTYLGGSGQEFGQDIAVDSGGNAYVTVFTQSVDFPTASPLQSALGGVRDAFVAKLDPTGSALVYSTYLGGSAPDVGESIALDASNNAYVTGFTDSSNFPTQNPIQGALNGTADAFVTKVNSAGSALVYSTYLGGSGEEGGFGIAVDTTGSAYVSGRTRSIDFPTVNPIQPSFAGGIDTF